MPKESPATPAPTEAPNDVLSPSPDAPPSPATGEAPTAPPARSRHQEALIEDFLNRFASNDRQRQGMREMIDARTPVEEFLDKWATPSLRDRPHGQHMKALYEKAVS